MLYQKLMEKKFPIKEYFIMMSEIMEFNLWPFRHHIINDELFNQGDSTPSLKNIINITENMLTHLKELGLTTSQEILIYLTHVYDL